ncbi:hypothetical protein FNU76_06300 [Chitinimonas arctica]|uniref:Uncharacterized protein n=1 Tax=Chitinimonas arctica TaxID=2594795 RepID=A0A516SCW3_9NEIS|nr:hypothetical protein [Chitinimonas arctica]QDQ25993.1 hypothetical protein FNU76_06300 [Chitinimonas arctica]
MTSVPGAPFPSRERLAVGKWMKVMGFFDLFPLYPVFPAIFDYLAKAAGRGQQKNKVKRGATSKHILFPVMAGM